MDEVLPLTVEQINLAEAAEADSVEPVSVLDNSKIDADTSNDENSDEESWHSKEWKSKERHLFILSSAGKPIYTRYGNEDKMASLFGIMQAIVSTFQEEHDEILSIRCEDTQFAFLRKEYLILMLVSKVKNENIEECHQQLNYIFNQILSTLTLSQLARVFDQRNNFDLRRLLAGCERLIDSMIVFTETEPSFFLLGIQCLPLPCNTRDSIVQAITSSCSKLKNLLFAVLVSNNQLVSVVRLKKYDLQPQDIHIIYNLVNCSPSFKSAESWSPLCLPTFDSSGFLQVHCSYLADDCEICLLLIAVERDMFYALSEAKKNIVEKLRKTECITVINESLSQPKLRSSELGISGLRHFIYKDKNIKQFLFPAYESPYVCLQLQNQLFQYYKTTYYKLNSSSCSLKLIYQKKDTEVMLAWDTKLIQLFTVWEPFMTKQDIIDNIDKLIKAIKKKEDRLFILNSPTF